jgi:predicted transglutaminase-like cysteine proteinase
MKMIRINREVNAFIIPTSDLEHWGVLEHWDIPTPKDPHGDCEDYVLLKRQRFIDELGWSTDALLITVVRETNGEWHAVLVVRTQGGDYVLDNLSDSIVPSYVTSYRYFKRQSDHDPNVWVVFGDGPPTDLAAFNKKNKK